MVDPLYSVLAFTCAFVLLIFKNQFRIVLDKSEKTDKDFLYLANWVIVFCLQDGIWGIFGCGAIKNNFLLFLSSSFFHAAAAVMAFIWLNYILNFINIEREKAIPAKILSLALVIFQLILLLMNFRSSFLFGISDEGTYIVMNGRNLLYYSQYFTFFVIAIFLVYKTASAKKTSARKHYAAGFLFISAPVLCGFLQREFPFSPCDSIGSMLGCCTIYAFFISKISRNRDLSQKAVIIAGLSSDYDVVVYVNIPKNHAKFYQISEKFTPLLWEGRNSTNPKDFDNFMKRIYVPNEFSEFIEKSTIDKCIELLQSAPYYTIPFLASINGQIEHYRLKIASDKSNAQGFIIGIINVEEEHRLEELVECDVNDLKVINDTFGHDMGDEYLKNCSKVFCDIFKHSPVFRIGGDEFVIILFGEQYEKRAELFEKLKSSVNRKPDAPKESISFAAGMADYSSKIDECVKDVLKRADTFMYINKGKFKN